MGEHSILSPSKGEMILSCAAALAASKNEPNVATEYAAEGTAYHYIASVALEHRTDCAQYVGCTVEVTDEGAYFIEPELPKSPSAFRFTIDEDNAAYAQRYVDAVRKLPGAQYYEQWVDTSEVVGVPGQGGTIDCVTLDYEHETLHIADLKFGRGEIVYAEGNKQLLQYGAAALLKWGLMADWKYLHVEIHQPRVNHYSEHTYSYAEVEDWVADNKPSFQHAYALYQDPTKMTEADFNPTEKGCRWCPISSRCYARTQAFIAQFPITPEPARAITLSDEELGAERTRVESLEAYIADIKKEAHQRAVVLGKTLPGWKVVQGRKGNRKWTDVEQAESAMRDKLLDGAYKPREILSPADAEKKLRKDHASTWTHLQQFITQSEGSLSLERDDSPKPVVATGIEFPVQEPTS